MSIPKQVSRGGDDSSVLRLEDFGSRRTRREQNEDGYLGEYDKYRFVLWWDADRSVAQVGINSTRWPRSISKSQLMAIELGLKFKFGGEDDNYLARILLRTPSTPEATECVKWCMSELESMDTNEMTSKECFTSLLAKVTKKFGRDPMIHSNSSHTVTPKRVGQNYTNATEDSESETDDLLSQQPCAQENPTSVHWPRDTNSVVPLTESNHTPRVRDHNVRQNSEDCTDSEEKENQLGHYPGSAEHTLSVDDSNNLELSPTRLVYPVESSELDADTLKKSIDSLLESNERMCEELLKLNDFTLELVKTVQEQSSDRQRQAALAIKLYKNVKVKDQLPGPIIRSQEAGTPGTSDTPIRADLGASGPGLNVATDNGIMWGTTNLLDIRATNAPEYGRRLTRLLWNPRERQHKKIGGSRFGNNFRNPHTPTRLNLFKSTYLVGR